MRRNSCTVTYSNEKFISVACLLHCYTLIPQHIRGMLTKWFTFSALKNVGYGNDNLIMQCKLQYENALDILSKDK